MSRLQVHELCFAYAQQQVFTDWSAQFDGGLAWLRGGNGSGKSTLLRLLAGAMPAGSGEIRANGLDVSAHAMAYRREVFWCGPGPVPFDHLSPTDYFAFLRGLYPSWHEPALTPHVDGFALTPHLHTPLRQLSTGTQRKVWLTAAFAANTSITLLDEPLNALDTASLDHLRATLAACSRDSSRLWIVASHEPLGDEVRLAQRIELASQ
jgi:ABC-type multidrug transport system ATPase subunit